MSEGQGKAPARAAATAGGQIRVMCGVHTLEVGLAGRTVGELRQALAQPLNIDPRAVAVVNGAQVSEAYVTKAKDQVEFVRLAGEKGLAVSARRGGAVPSPGRRAPPGSFDRREDRRR